MTRPKRLLKSTATPTVQNLRKLILPLFVLTLLTGCAAGPKVLTEYKTETVFVPVRTPLADDLLERPAPCTLPPTNALYIFDLDQWAACVEGQATFYARQLTRIIEANKKPPEGGESLNGGGGGQ